MWYVFALIGIVVVATVLTQAWFLRETSHQQRRLAHRLDELTGRMGGRMAPPTAAADNQDAALLDALMGERAPMFSLPNLAGERVILDTLLALGTPLLLLFTDPRCGPCYELLPDIGGWQRVYGNRLATTLISSGEQGTNTAMIAGTGIAPGAVLLQTEREVTDDYGLEQLPAAVLVQPDGRIGSGPRFGTRAIRQLVADSLGLTLPPVPAVDVTTVTVGDAVPPLRRPDLRGRMVDLAASRGMPSLVLFWNPGCRPCRELLPAILAAEQRLNGLGMVIVSQGPIGLTEGVGFSSPTVFDDDQSIARTLGVEGSPSAVVINGHGKVATRVFRGEHRVRALLERIAASTEPAA
jgi:thiol-disulfide isomerase/thioredoxin